MSSREIEAGVAPFARVLVLSPAEKAMQLLQQKLPVVTDVVTDVEQLLLGLCRSLLFLVTSTML